MFSVNFNSASQNALTSLYKAQSKASTSLERLSSGLRINHGSDDPSGLIASESFKANSATLNQAINNTTRAGNMIGTAEGDLTEIGGLLTGLQSSVGAVANGGAITQDERDAAQADVDSVIAQITKIASGSSFNGKKLLDGSLGYRVSGVTSTALSNVVVNSAKVPTGGSKTLSIAVQTAATQGTVTYTGGTLAAGNNVSLELTGNSGTQQISFAAGTTIAQQATAINATTNDTGVIATVSGTNLLIQSADYGSTQNVSAKVLSGTYTASATSAAGTDAVVRVNGALAAANGINVTYRDNSTDSSFTLTTTSNVAGQTTSFNVTGGGADFQLGSRVTDANRSSIGINSVAATSLGSATLGTLSTLRGGEANALAGTNLATAQKIVDASVKQVASLRGRLGMFQKYQVDSNINSLQSELEQSDETGSAIRDADFATETAELSRQQILQQASQSIFAVANQQPQQILSLLSAIR